MGAWIEILPSAIFSPPSQRRPRMGAWIEIVDQGCRSFRPHRRPRMGAWIEIKFCFPMAVFIKVAPVWGRGLKFDHLGNG